jgi:glycosyltransferase involved in cell wall biosynthesis
VFTDLPDAPPSDATAWEVPLAERIGQLFARRRRVAWVYRTPDTSTFRYRAANMVAALNAQPDGEIGAAWFSETELSTINHLVPELDAVVLVRYPWSGPLQRLVDKAHHHGVPLVFDTDDLVFDPSLVPLVMDALHVDRDDFRNWQLWYAYTAQLGETLSACGSAITTGPPLRAHLAPHVRGGAVAVVPNFLDRSQEEFSRELLATKLRTGFRRSGPVTLGYFSGTPTHARDFAVAVPAVVRLLERDPDVRLRLVGRLDVAEELADFEERIEVLPFMSFIELQRAIAEAEVNLAPLQSHAFTACKSELKYFEAAAVGTWTVASASPAFCAAIDDGRTGRVARAWEWDGALDEAVALARDPDAYGAKAEEAAREAYAAYGWDVHAPTLERALAPCWQGRSDPIASADTKGDRR